VKRETNIPDRLYTFGEVAKILAISTTTLRELRANGKIKTVTFGYSIQRIKGSEIQRFINSLKQGN